MFEMYFGPLVVFEHTNLVFENLVGTPAEILGGDKLTKVSTVRVVCSVL